jgi:phosphate transport system substrate-binding protein
VHFRVIWRLWFLLALATSAGSQASPRIQMAGAGSTSTIPIYSSWFQSFEKIHPDNHFSYLPISSEVGAKMAGDGAADFGGSDIALTGRELTQARVLQFPTVLIAIVPIYNLKGITEPIRFSTRVRKFNNLGFRRKLFNQTNLSQTKSRGFRRAIGICFCP